MTERISRKQLIVTAAAVFAAALALVLFIALRSAGPEGQGQLVGLAPSPSGAPTASATAPTANTGATAASGTPAPGASPTEVPAPTLNDVTPTVTPSPKPNATTQANPTFPPTWKGTLTPASPTPAPRAEMWRLEGVVIDPQGNPLKDVCVAIGPHGCQATSPRTDANGVYWADLPKADVVYDLHFFRDGFATADRSIHPLGPTRLDVLLQS